MSSNQCENPDDGDCICPHCIGVIRNATKSANRWRLMGAKEERARIIKWLRANNDSCCHAGDNLADDIEKGNHE